MNFLDLVIIGALLLGGLTGYRKGLINSIIGVLSSLISFIAAFATYKSLTPVLHVQLGVGKFVQGVIKESMTIQAQSMQLQPIKGNVLNQIALITNVLPKDLQKEFDSMFVNLMKSAAGTTIKTLSDAVIQYFTLVILSFLTFFLIFIVTKWLLGFLGMALTKNLDRSIIGNANHSGGFVAGTITSLLFVSILMGFLVPLFAIYPQNTFSRLVDQSLLAPYMTKVFTGITYLLGQMLR